MLARWLRTSPLSTACGHGLPTTPYADVHGQKGDKQESWRKDLLRTYGSLSTDGTKAWFPIVGGWVSTSGIKSAHIVKALCD
jgi:hypothetical protein